MDDLNHIDRLLADHGSPDTPPILLDLCSGIGRTVPLALQHGWNVVCIDADEAALATTQQIAPTRITCHIADLAAPGIATLPTCRGILCAHNAANEVGTLQPLFEIAADTLHDDGWFYLDLLTDTYPRPFELEHVLRIESTDPGVWLLDTAMVPLAENRHRLHLIATHYDLNGRQINQTHHALIRVVFPHEVVVGYGRKYGLHLHEKSGNHYVFRRRRPSSKKGG
ncbi:class I SAM-dependent methyltransferase [Nocardia donostiensis]|uniref:class I SAM-dependent methyltransferase n=1 Tax=Nocardia donostiensis TaxID=1538463 RepID=UPI001115A0EB|nr:class I SAM-dependent methyltransferase [Nocardia donostiensis]